MIIKDLLKKYYKVEIELELLLAHVLKKPKEFLYLNPSFKLTIKQLSNLAKLVNRRLKGEPVAYILGYKDFYGLRFKVNRHVLIPRPETEWVVEKISNIQLPISKRPIRILDLGTGSGAIIISIAKILTSPNPSLEKEGDGPILPLRPGHPFIAWRKWGGFKGGASGGYEFIASDISKKALAVAKQNAKIHKAKIKFVHSDMLENIRMSPDIIIANL